MVNDFWQVAHVCLNPSCANPFPSDLHHEALTSGRSTHLGHATETVSEGYISMGWSYAWHASERLKVVKAGVRRLVWFEALWFDKRSNQSDRNGPVGLSYGARYSGCRLRGLGRTVMSGGWSGTSTAIDYCPRNMFEGSMKPVLGGCPAQGRHPPTNRCECKTINTSRGASSPHYTAELY